MKDFLPVFKDALLYLFCCFKSFFNRFIPNIKHSFKSFSEAFKYTKNMAMPYVKAIKLRWVVVWFCCVGIVAAMAIIILSLTTDYYILTYKEYNLGYLRNTEMVDATIQSVKDEFEGNDAVAKDLDLFGIQKIKIGNIFLDCMDKDELREMIVAASERIEYGYKVFIDDKYIIAVADTIVFDNALLDFKNDRITLSDHINSNYDECDIQVSNEITTQRECMLVEDITTKGSYQGLYTAFEQNLKYRIECLQTVPEKIPYITHYYHNDKLSPGDKNIIQNGEYGIKTVQNKVIVENETLVSSKIVKEKIVKKSVARKVEIGNGTKGGVDGGIVLLLPIEGYLTSDFGYRPDPFTGETAFHTGLDIGATTGTPIQAAASGKVIQASDKKNGYGKCVIIEHASGFKTLYAHCSSLDVKVGEYVAAGDIVARVGSTGRSTGPHLHFSIIINDDYVDPNLYF